MNDHYVLDSYAILALLNDEPGADRAEFLLQQAKNDAAALSMSVINLGELVYIVERRWGTEKLRTVLAYLETAPIQMAVADKGRVFAAAHIKAHNSLSYADAYAAALAQELNATLLTGDPEFQSLGNQILIEWLPT